MILDAATDGRPRHPVLRTGERAPIDPYARRLIYERDGRACQWCGSSVRLQLDHVIPWSANGSDRSDNLRTLCEECNEGRSNYIDDAPPRLIGVTRACYWCAKRRRELPNRLVDVDPGELDRISAYCGCCGTTSWVPDTGWIL